MPLLFVLAIITTVPALACAATWLATRDEGPGAAALALAALTAVLVFFSGWAVVPTQDIGITTSFGRPVGHLTNGLHWTAPWTAVTEMDGAIQTDSYTRATCVDVRIARQQTACATVSVRWRIEPGAADTLYRNYHGFGGVQDSLVTRELAVALNQQFAAYDPIASLTSATPPGSAGNPTVAQLAQAVTSQMRRELAGQIRVSNVLIPLITFDPTVQGRINSVLAQVAQTDIAGQAIRTAQAQAQANRDLSASVSNDPGVLVSRCLDLVGEAIKAGYSLPPGFSCFGPSQVGVIAGGAGK